MPSHSKPTRSSRSRRSALAPRRPRSSRCLRPSCLCNRSLGKSLLEARDFRVVTCTYGCKRPQFYFHESCASLYVQSLRTCGYCKARLISLNNTKDKCLRDALQTNRSLRRRRRLGATAVSLNVQI